MFAFYWIKNSLLFFLILYTITLIRNNKQNKKIKLERKNSLIIMFSLVILLSLLRLSVPYYDNGISIFKLWALEVSENRGLHDPFDVIVVISYIVLNLLVLIGYLRFKRMKGLKLLYGTVFVLTIDSVLALILILVTMYHFLLIDISLVGQGLYVSISYLIVSITSGVYFFFYLTNNGFINRKNRSINLKLPNNIVCSQSKSGKINISKNSNKNRHYIIIITIIYIVEFILLMITLYGSYFKTNSLYNEYLSIYTQNHSTLYITVLYLLFYGYLILFIILCNTRKLIRNIVSTVKSLFTLVLIVLLFVQMIYIDNGLYELLTISFGVAFYSHILLIIISIVPILVLVPCLEPLTQD